MHFAEAGGVRRGAGFNLTNHEFCFPRVDRQEKGHRAGFGARPRVLTVRRNFH